MWYKSFVLALAVTFEPVYTQQACNTGSGTISVPLQNITLLGDVVRWGAAITLGTPPQSLAFWPAAKLVF